MKVLLFVSKLAGGGAERVASDLSLNLPDDIECTIVLLEDNIEYPYRGNLKVLKTITVSKFNVFVRFWNIFSRLFQFRKIVRQEKPDWIIAFSPALCLLSGFVYKKTIATVHCQHNINDSTFIEKKKIRHAHRVTQKVVAVSKGVKADLRENFGINKDIEVLYNPLDLASIKELSEQPLGAVFSEWVNDNLPLFITAGRMGRQKGQWHLLRAFAKVRKSRKCQLVILGQGILEDKLKKLARDLEVDDSVLFLGFQSNPFTYLSRADVFVFTSLWEGFGKVITEAMACGLPVISTDCRSGPREILAPETDFRKEAKEVEYGKYGVLTPVPDGVFYRAGDVLTIAEERLADAMLDLITDKEKRESYALLSRRRAEDFAVEQWIEQWLKVLEYNK